MIYDEHYMKRLEAFELKFNYSQGICNATDYTYRQQILLEEVCEFILEPLIAKRLEEESRFNQDEKEDYEEQEIRMWRERFLKELFYVSEKRPEIDDAFRALAYKTMVKEKPFRAIKKIIETFEEKNERNN
jgi:hypothetical protein